MDRFSRKYFNAALAASDGSAEEMLRNLYLRVFSSDFIRKVGETFAARVLLIGIGLMTTVIVARILGPEGRGLYGVALTMVAIGVQFGNFGLHASNTYYVAKNRALLPALMGNTLLVSFGVGGIGAALAWLLFFLWPSLAPVHGNLLVLSLGWIPFGLASMLMQNLLLGLDEIRGYNIVELASRIIALALIGLEIIYGMVTVEMVLLATFMALVISLAGSLWRLKRHLKCFPLLSFALLKESSGYALKAYLGAFLAFLVLRVNLLMVQYMLGAKQAGYYSIAVTLGDMVYLLPLTVGALLFPRLSGMSSHREKWHVTRRATLWVGVTMVLFAGCAALGAGPAVRILFGEAFLPSVPAFIGLLPGIVLLSINTCYMNYFAATGMPLVTVVSPALAAVITIVVNLKLIPWLGIVGASMTSVLSYGLMLGASVVYISYFEKEQR
jgi:O-antigen/teichoic acid export membrane protein